MFCWYGSRMEIAGKYLKDLFKKFGLIN